MSTEADYSIYMDVDLSTQLEAIPRVLQELKNGADLVTGSRVHPESNVVRCLKREVLSRGYIFLIRQVMRTQSFDDAQCGFKGVRCESIRRLLPLVEDQNWFFDTELLVLSELAGYTVSSVPVTWVEDHDSRVNIPKTVLEDLRGLARLRKSARRMINDWRQSGTSDAMASGQPDSMCCDRIPETAL